MMVVMCVMSVVPESGMSGWSRTASSSPESGI
jgi:hypothetical protein